MNAVDSPFIEALDIFETEGTRGMPRASIDKLPEIKITNGGNVDATGERIGCSVCLQVGTLLFVDLLLLVCLGYFRDSLMV